MKIFDKWQTFRKDADLKTWIYRITINQSLDFLKYKQRKKRSFIISLLSSDSSYKENLLPDFDHPGILMEQDESLKILMQKIYRLPKNQKTVIILLKIEDLSQREVAEIMKLTEGAVESLFQRAKTSLKKETNIFSPTTPYAISRSAQDLNLLAYCKTYNFPVVFTRAANIYGPYQQSFRIIPKIIISILTNKKILTSKFLLDVHVLLKDPIFIQLFFLFLLPLLV